MRQSRVWRSPHPSASETTWSGCFARRGRGVRRVRRASVAHRAGHGLARAVRFAPSAARGGTRARSSPDRRGRRARPPARGSGPRRAADRRELDARRRRASETAVIVEPASPRARAPDRRRLRPDRARTGRHASRSPAAGRHREVRRPHSFALTVQHRAQGARRRVDVSLAASSSTPFLRARRAAGRPVAPAEADARSRAWHGASPRACAGRPVAACARVQPSAVRGSIAAPRTRTSKCRCGPVAWPVAPTAPTRAPAATHARGRTSMRDRCAYHV